MTKIIKDPVTKFFEERKSDIDKMGQDNDFQRKSMEWILHANKYKYAYN